MKEVWQWARAFEVNAKPWLLLGKGPSFDRLSDADLEAHFVCALNHVVREFPVTLAQVIDLDVARQCADAIYRNARWLVMPYHPHDKMGVSPRGLPEHIDEIEVLRALDSEGRLLWYNLSSGPPRDDGPVVPLFGFSASAALALLARCGVATVRSLGVDGGTGYARRFADLLDTTHLACGEPSFDTQWPGIAQTLREFDILYAPLRVPAPARVFVGAGEAEALPARVLEHSIRQHARMSVEVVPIDIRGMPVPRDPEKRSKTRFSFARFRIPELCGHAGRGIYLDSDMLVFRDITSLWTWPMEGAHVLTVRQPPERGRPSQTSVMLMDCAALGWDVAAIIGGLDAGRYGYRDLMEGLAIVPAANVRDSLPFEWNSLESYDEGRTCLLHYTDVATQPWLSDRNPLGGLWYDALRAAIDAGFISEFMVREEIAKGHVHRELLAWIGLAPPTVPVSGPLDSLLLDFSRRLPGANWWGPENHPHHGWFQWTGPGARSSLELPLGGDRDLRLRFHVLYSLAPLDSLRLSVNAEPVALDRHDEGGVAAFSAILPRSLFTAGGEVTVLTLDVAGTVLPRELDPNNDDPRQLGVAIFGLEIGVKP